MNEHFIRIVGFGLIGTDNKRGPFRQVIFKDETNNQQAELLVNKKERPALWSDIEKMEKGGNLPPYQGKVATINNLSFVVFSGESIDNAFERKRHQVSVKGRISYEQAEGLRIKSKGYITNLTIGKAIEISWRPIEKEVSMIKFRDYISNGKFVWSNWYEIIKK